MPDASVAAPRRYAKSEATRARILDAAHALFVERGFRAVSLRDLAAAADLSHPGLLRHFASTDAVLDALVEQLEARTQEWLGEAGVAVVAEVAPGIARRNLATPGYTELFTALTGEATTDTHPAHARMRRRYEQTRALATTDGAFTTDESIRLTAVWDGLQLLSLYDPDIDVPTELEAYLAWVRDGVPPQAATPSSAGSAHGTPEHGTPDPSAIIADAAAASPGYAPGRLRRQQLVAEAMAAFANRGFHASSLRQIADSAGIAKSTLLHHFPTKDDLLTAVLVERDRRIVERSTADAAAPAERSLQELPRQVRLDTREEAGLIEVYAVLVAEAATPGHPAHAYFRDRYVAVRRYFADLIAQAAAHGAVVDGVDPDRAALWLVAEWDGLQFQWLYAPDEVDLAGNLEAHLARLLVD
ncbi:TetR/AcrR family transcriptional regulator [Agromyces sp. MMS24-K17]|uniref:TetR/AcrR family transcriptional regulator n=1 Tax=Agromyces sp. MMS24-K17 TaxID=3372850 RepID=UPI003754AD02